MKNRIIEIAKAEKISDIGFCNIADYREESKTLDKPDAFGAKARKTEILKNARTAIVCAFNYYAGAEKGNISRYAQGEDYHKTVVKMMMPIAEFLKKSGYRAEIFADIGVLNERLLAVMGGIAFIGRNRMAISQKIGSYFFIGYILTDAEIEKDEKNTMSCMDCGACIKACPLGALDKGFCEEKCVSYITQKKGELAEWEEEAIRKAKTIWGCDICQEACPHNRDIPTTEIAAFRENRIIDLDFDDEISNKEFQKRYKNRAFSWRGKAVLVRNKKISKKSKKN